MNPRSPRVRALSRVQDMNGYTVFKQTGTLADALATIGAVGVPRHLEPRIVELADRLEICLREPLAPSDLEGVDAGLSYLDGPAELVTQQGQRSNPADGPRRSRVMP